MANRFPLVVNTATSRIAELPAGDNLDLSLSNISNVGNIVVSSTVTASNVVVNELDVGTKIVPITSKSTDYTLVLADSGTTILHPYSDSNSRTFTIPSNSSVSFPVGTVITFMNMNDLNDVNILITTDTMYLAGSGNTDSRTLTSYGVATIIKIASTEWVISGVGLS